MFRHWRMFGGLLALLLKTSVLSAQPAVTCFVNVAVPPIMRLEGVTELAGDIVLNCNGTAPPGGLTANLQVFLNTTLTSRIIGGVSEALVLINEPASGSQTLGVNLFQGTVSAPNAVTFLAVPFSPTASGAFTNHVLRITNIRANASLLGGPPVPIVSAVTAGGGIALSNPSQTVGFGQRGMTFETQCTDTPPSSVNLRFSELFATAFKPRGGTGQSTPGAIYNTESGFTPNPIIANVGTADSGTELGAALSGIPGGVTLSVPAFFVSGTLVIGAVTPPGGGVVPVVAGNATIVYEVLFTNPNAPESVSIPVTVSSLPLAGATVRGNLYPISSVPNASAIAPIPRFLDSSTALPFGACAGVPTLTHSGLLFLALGLLTVGSVAIRRRTAQ